MSKPARSSAPSPPRHERRRRPRLRAGRALNAGDYGDHIFRCAAHAPWQTARRQNGAVDRRPGLGLLLQQSAGIRDRRHDFRSSRHRRLLQGRGQRLLTAIHVGSGLSGASGRNPDHNRRRPRLRVSGSDGLPRLRCRGATLRPRPSCPPRVEKDLTPWPAETAKRRFLERFAALAETDRSASRVGDLGWMIR